ncbi:MAG: type II secretion system protein [Lentisphaeria bacterium]
MVDRIFSTKRFCQHLLYKRYFTLIEMLIVTLIIAMIFMAVLPKMLSIPKRLIVEKACSDIQRAFVETALSARISGESKMLVLNTLNGNTLNAKENHLPSLTDNWTPPLITSILDEDENAENQEEPQKDSFWDFKKEYELTSDLEWITNEIDYDPDVGVIFVFFPDGQAAGPNIQFNLKKRTFNLSLDHVTGHLNIAEELD